jgi:hypothetical protein
VKCPFSLCSSHAEDIKVPIQERAKETYKMDVVGEGDADVLDVIYLALCEYKLRMAKKLPSDVIFL